MPKAFTSWPTDSHEMAHGRSSRVPGFRSLNWSAPAATTQVRRTTVGAILNAGGSLRRSSGPPHHHDLYGLTPQQFDAILSLVEPNPVPKPDRWKPS